MSTRQKGRAPLASYVAAFTLAAFGGQVAGAAVTASYNFEGIDSIPWVADNTGDFEARYTDNEGGKFLRLKSGNTVPTLNKNVAVGGSQSMCFKVNVEGTHNAYSDRSEVEIDAPKKGGYNIFENDEYWYAFNIRPDAALKPNPIRNAPDDRVSDVVVQFHNTTDRNDTTIKARGPWIQLASDGIHWILIVRGSAEPHAGYNADAESLRIGPVQPGKWTSFIFNVKFNSAGDGWVRLWENGTLVFNKQISNTLGDGYTKSNGGFMKLGVYAWWLENDPMAFKNAAISDGNLSRDYCHDRIRVAEKGSSCQALAPPGVACDPLPATFGYEWDGSAPINEGPPDTHAAQFYSFIGVKANHSTDGYPPQNATDGNLSTYWSSDAGDAYLELDLGSVVPISKVYIAWIKGDQRQESFQVFMGGGTSSCSTGTITSSGSTAGLEAYSTPCNARYVRIYGYGNTQNRYNSIAEIKVAR